MVLERLQSSRNRSCPGLAIRKGGEVAWLNFGNRANRAEQKLPIRELTIGRDIQTNRECIVGLANVEAAGFRQGWSQQAMPRPA